MSKIPVSVCIIAKNEEKHIENCLKNLKPYGFEIIVTDTGSTDKTKEIAEKFADKVVDFAWNDDFATARNFCAAQASNNWILSLDCDEYVKNIDIPTFRNILQKKYLKYIGTVRLKSLGYTEEGEKRYISDDVQRFYNRNFFHYEWAIHEQLMPLNPKINTDAQRCVMLPMEVIHYGYLISKEEMQEKQKRNLKLLYTALEKKPDDPYLHFQIGQSELLLGNKEVACSHYEKGLSYDVDPEITYVQIMIESLAIAYSRLGRYNEAQALMEKYQSQCQTAKYTYVQANIYMDNNQPMKGLLFYIKATAMDDTETLGEGLLLCYQNIINIYTQIGNKEMASLFQDKYEKCIAERKRIVGE